MLPHILPLIPDHTHYCEPFFGSGAVFFAKKRSRIETINDRSDALINFYREANDHYEALLTLIRGTLYSETEYRRASLILKNPSKVEATKWAWAYWVVVNMSHCGDLTGGFSYSVSSENKDVISFRARKLAFEQFRGRLEYVQIFNRDALKVIVTCDSEGTFFYLDPPYPLADQGHYSGYTMKNFLKLLKVLSRIRGKFILSSYAYPVLVRYSSVFGWQQEQYEKIVSVGSRRDKKVIEVLTYNFKPISENIGPLFNCI